MANIPAAVTTIASLRIPENRVRRMQMGLLVVQPPSYPEPLPTAPTRDSVAVMPFPRSDFPCATSVDPVADCSMPRKTGRSARKTLEPSRVGSPGHHGYGEQN